MTQDAGYKLAEELRLALRRQRTINKALVAALEGFLPQALRWQHAPYCAWLEYKTPCSCGLAYFERDARDALVAAKATTA